MFDIGLGDWQAKGFPAADAPPHERRVSYLRAPQSLCALPARQKHMDAAAVIAGYDDIKTAVTYADEPAVPKFQAEGIAFRAWRSLVWAYGYEQMSAVQSGARELPTIEVLIAELPPLVLP